MVDGEIVLEICVGISFFITVVIVTIGCVKNHCKKDKIPTMKQSPSMEELTAISVDDPVGV